MIDEQELETLARALGGGWRVDHGVMPVVVLTLPEARKLDAQINELKDQILDLELHGPHDED